MGVRVDVGIDPYIETIGAFHLTCRVVPVRGGRLVAAPTGYWEKFVHKVVTHTNRHTDTVCPIAIFQESL